ncbi:MAG: trypsin-like peptidase domain-containing protein [Phycisphaerae bacterium]|nr:trypsin-like peptidase domain-containing protein [Phycisphaerae bacterium]
MNTTKLWLPFLIVGVLVWCSLYCFAPSLVDRISYARQAARLRAITENMPDLKDVDRLSAMLREVSRAVKPAVVEVRVAGSGEFDRWRRVPGNKSGSVGSGVIVDSENGYVVTNEHVISDADAITVVLADGREFVAEWVRFDRMTDLAVIKIAPERLMQISMGDSDKVEVGDQVFAIGSPMGLPQTVTFGRISAKGRMTARSDTYQNYIQTDAAINHGNSGGPLIDMSGKIIGINVAIVSRSGTNAGLGLAIPSNRVKRVTDQLIKNGKAMRGFIGLEIDTPSQAVARRLNLPHTKGALVRRVAPGGPGDLAGIETNDFILSVDSKTVVNSQKFRHFIADIKPGTVVPIQIYRDGETMIVSVKIILQPDDMRGAFPR